MKIFAFFSFIIPLFCYGQTDTITIYFDIAKHEAVASELEKLKVSEAWKKIDIISYTDYLGSEEYNQKLSIKRSREIRSRLVQRGLDTENLGRVEGKGITGERLNSLEGIQKNRRTDIIIRFDKNLEHVESNSIVENVDPVEELENSIIEKNLTVSIAEMKVGDNLALKKLSFLGGRHYLTEESKPYLDSLLKVMLENRNLKIVIEGHICCTIDGADGLDWETQTYTLSTERAKYVYDYLLKNGINKKRLDYEGFARKNPIYPKELTEDEKQANRRVEIRIVEK